MLYITHPFSLSPLYGNTTRDNSGNTTRNRVCILTAEAVVAVREVAGAVVAGDVPVSVRPSVSYVATVMKQNG